MDTVYTNILNHLETVNSLSNELYNNFDTINPDKNTCTCFVLTNKDAISKFITDIILKFGTNFNILKESITMNYPSSILQGLVENNMNVTYTSMITLESLISKINSTEGCCMLSQITHMKLRKLVYEMLNSWYNSFIWNKDYYQSLIIYRFDLAISELQKDELQKKIEFINCIINLNQSKSEFMELTSLELYSNEVMIKKITDDIKIVKIILQNFGILNSSDKYKAIYNLDITFNGWCRKWITSSDYYQNHGYKINEEYNKIEPFDQRTDEHTNEDMCVQ